MKNNYFKYIPYFFLLFFFIVSYKYMPIDKCYKFEEILTFLSIVLGFTFTGMTLISGAEFSKKLYSRESKKNNAQTQLHELVEIYFISTKWFIINSILIIFFSVFKSFFGIIILFSHEIDFYRIMFISITYLTIISFYKFYSLIKLFKNQVIQSVT